MRGKPTGNTNATEKKRNIPAYAGKTTKPGVNVLTAWEHPRVCGENWVPPLAISWGAGTSPRMRGKPPCPLSTATPSRNIPAYAGKTHCVATIGINIEEHPRVCGENNAVVEAAEKCEGTSPRMRGKLVSVLISSWEPGNIPAYAGKTAWRVWLSRLRAEHPRVCGENHTAMMQAKDAAGTSPRMRGKRPGQATLWGDIRNIPAYAGKTGLILTSGLTLTEHPRVCGENFDSLKESVSSEGTSPRMRGKPPFLVLSYLPR